MTKFHEVEHSARCHHSFRLSRGLLWLAALGVAVGVSPSTAQAYEVGPTTCLLGRGYEYWTSGARAVYTCTNQTFPGLSNSSVPAADKTKDKAMSAVTWAYWMWQRWSVGNMYLWVDQSASHNCSSGTDWVNNGNEVNETWWVPNGCDDDALACEWTDHRTCPTWGDNQILASDVVMNSSIAWEIVRQDTLARCLQRTSLSVENTALHEVGHSYTLAHQESAVSVINTQKPRVRNCDVASGYHDYPMPDDIQGFLWKHKGYSGTKLNVAGSPWYKSSGYGYTTNYTATVTSTTPASWTLSYSLHSFLDAGADILVSYYFVGEGTTPTFDASTGTWSNLGTASYYSTTSTVPGWFTHKQTIYMDVYYGELPSNGTYRLWVYVDSGRALSEIEEGDNVFPTNVVITRQ